MVTSGELRRVRSEGESTLAQTERERQSLTQALNTAQREAQQTMSSALFDHQEEMERLVSEKVRKWFIQSNILM